MDKRIDILKRYQRWRKGADFGEPFTDQDITEALEWAINSLESNTTTESIVGYLYSLGDNEGAIHVANMQKQLNRLNNQQPSKCKERLVREGKNFPRSDCEVCRKGLRHGCPYVSGEM